MTKPQRADKLVKLDGASRITNIPKATLAQRIDRRIFKTSSRDIRSHGSGQHKEFCRDTIVGFAIAQKLIELNVGAKSASEAAALFTDQPQPGRTAGDAFEFGRTLILCTKAKGSRIVNCGYNDSLIDILGRNFEAAVIVDVGKIIADVDEALKSEKKDH